MAASSTETVKLQQHLDLLREQYVKLQQRHADLEQKYARLLATSGTVGPDHFVSRLLKVVADLYDKSLYSDIDIVLGDRRMSGHRFVLAARSRHWAQDETLMSVNELDLSHMTPFVAGSLVRWVYTDSVILPSDQTAMIELLAATNKYHLTQLKEKCEGALVSSVTVRNCIKLYQASEEHSAESLKKYCLQMISSHWNNLNTSDFAEMSAPLLYEVFKAHTNYPLHLAIQHCREDVVFLYLIEFNSQLPGKLNECDSEGNLPLNLALLHRHEGIASTLVTNNCDLDVLDEEGNSLLQLAILRGDTFSASFLIKNGASTILPRKSTQETPLHLVAAYNPSQALTNVPSAGVKEAPWPSESMAQIASLLLEYHANPDSQDSAGNTPLQRAIQADNEDVFTILLINPVLNLELRNNDADTALWLALKKLDNGYLKSGDPTEYDHTFAARLIQRGANIDAMDSRTGNSTLHQAILESKEAAAVFLVHKGALPNSKNLKGEAPIHLAAMNGLHMLVGVLLENGADPNQQTALKPRPPKPVLTPSVKTPPTSRQSSKDLMSPTALEALSSLSYSAQANSNFSTDGTSGYGSRPHTPQSVHSRTPQSVHSRTPQLQSSQPHSLYNMDQMSQTLQMIGGAAMATDSPSFPRASNPFNSNPFGSDSEDEEDTPPPSPSGYHVSYPPSSEGSGMTPTLRAQPLQRNSSAQATPPIHHPPGKAGPPSATPPVKPPTPPAEKDFIEPAQEFDTTFDPGQRTALHLAIVHQHPEVVKVLLKHKGTSSFGKLEIGLNINLRDGLEETPLSLALWTNQFLVAQELMDAGADIESIDSDSPSMLYVAIVREKAKAARYLLDNGADFKKRTPLNESFLIAAIRHRLEDVADRLCELGVDVNQADHSGNSPLWVALRSKQEAVAARLIVHGCDPNSWHRAPDGSTLTLLHRAILLHDTTSACFLIRRGADINSPSRPGSSGEGVFSPPLHMACERGLQEVVRCLVEHQADINVKDTEGRCAIHVSILNKQPRCSDILLTQENLDLTARDKQNQTPFAVAMATKDNQIGLSILNREPSAAEQVDSRGQNFLHLAVLNEDTEGVIFLLSVRADVNSKVHNPTLNTPLHYAVKGGSEMLVRHLLLAGAKVTDVDNHQRCVLHMAVEGDFPTILSVLLENATDPDLLDEGGSNALHLAMQLGHLNCCKVLLEESEINLLSLNMKGQTCLHLLAKHGKENAAAIFSMLLATAPRFPLDKQDNDGNTPLLLAYLNGGTALCDSLVLAGAHPSIPNKQGLSIFNVPVATKQLLFRILEQITSEPNWLEGNFCQNCNLKFNISHRKHHCRHCGRLLCKQCTNHQMPILKFDLSKAVRVCEVCSDLFKIGASR